SPVRSFFRNRLDVVFRDEEDPTEDEESFGVGGLAEYGLLAEVLQQVLHDAPALGSGDAQAADLRSQLAAQVARQRRAGRLPVGELGARAEQALVDDLVPMLDCWAETASRYPEGVAAERLRFEADGLVLEDWLGGVRAPGDAVGDGE